MHIWAGALLEDAKLDHGLRTPSLLGRKSNPNPKFLGSMAEAYFVCHISPKFKISLIYAFIVCP